MGLSYMRYVCMWYNVLRFIFVLYFILHAALSPCLRTLTIVSGFIFNIIESIKWKLMTFIIQ